MAMKLWGLTGGIACGKSTISRRLRTHGAFIIDADLIARDVVALGTPGLAQIREEFGSHFLNEDGTLNRGALGVLITYMPLSKIRLENIIHPLIAKRGEELIVQAEKNGAEVAVYDAALLIETGLYKKMQQVLVATVSPDVQLQRAMARDGLTEEMARKKIFAQLPSKEKCKFATKVFDTGDTIEKLYDAVDQFWMERNL